MNGLRITRWRSKVVLIRRSEMCLSVVPKGEEAPMNRVERVSERLARGCDRRRFLKQAASTIFGGAATFAAGSFFAPSAEATHGTCPNQAYPSCFCSPPGGLYCTSLSSSYCNGASCAGGCSWNTDFYPDACWCTKTCISGQCTAYHYMCCDCWCSGGTACGCRHQIIGSVASRRCLDAAA